MSEEIYKQTNKPNITRIIKNVMLYVTELKNKMMTTTPQFNILKAW